MIQKKNHSPFTIHHSQLELTATGIAPDLHRTSLLIPAMNAGNRYGSKSRGAAPVLQNKFLHILIGKKGSFVCSYCFT
jgi:hypothetical protein